MSIVRQLVQTSIVEALRHQTIAGDCVFDSRMDTIEGLLDGSDQPLIIVSVEMSDQPHEGQVASGLLGRDATLTVLIQTAVATGRTIKNDDGEVIFPAIGVTDAAFEATLNILDRQWRHVLHDFDNPWADVFKGLTVKILDIKDARSTDPETNRKHAARFVEFGVKVMPDPEPGEELPAPIENGLALMEKDLEFAALAAEWREILRVDQDWPEWRRVQSSLFATRKEIAALGYGPITIDDLVPFDHATLDISRVGQVTVDAEDDDD